MTLANQTSKNIYVGDDSTLVFAYTFRIFEDADLEVTIQDTSVDPQTEITLVLTSDYTVSGADDPTGGNVTLVLGGQLSVAPTTTDNITIRRALPLTQPTDYVENDPFPADAHEDTVDRSRMIDQQLQEEVDRSIKLAANITGVSVILPTPESGAPIGWNTAADALTNNPDNLNQVKVDTDASPDFIGATSGDGVLRTSGLLTYSDGGNFVTLGLTNAAIDHDALTNFDAAEHFTMLDEDNMASNSDTQAATQQSIVAYVASQVALVNEFTELTDTPGSYSGETLKITRVNAGETAIEFVTLNAALVPIADGSGIITATDVEGALQENRTAIDLNTAKVTNQTHTGDVTGSVALTLESVAITGQGAGTVASGDLVLIADIDDSNNLKQVTAQSIADLGSGGAPLEVEDEGISLSTAVTKINFAGAGVTATEPVSNEILVTIPGGGGGGATLTEDVNQTTHGFSVGDWVYHNGTIYALADASAATTAESIGVVSAVAGVDDFTIQFGGKVTGLSGLTAGEAHFLSETAGAITATAPSTEDSVIKPVLIADSTTTGFIFNMRGIAVTSTTSFYQSFVDADLTAGVATFTHNLGHKFALVQVFDENDDLVQPDDINLVDANSLTVDLTSFGTLTGTWNVVILDVGTTNSSVASDLSLSGQAAEDFAIYDGANWVAKGGVEKIITVNFTKDLSDAVTSQGVTGVGFKPSAVHFIGCVNGAVTYSTGHDDGTNAHSIHNQGASGTLWERDFTNSIRLETGASDIREAEISSFDADGFTLNWSKVGSPTGTGQISALCYR